MGLLGWFRTGPERPVGALPTEEVIPQMRRAQWRIFLSLLFGYACFYTCRLSLSVAKKPMLAAEVVTLEELGFIGSALFFTYAFGKLTNGFHSPGFPGAISCTCLYPVSGNGSLHLH